MNGRGTPRSAALATANGHGTPAANGHGGGATANGGGGDTDRVSRSKAARAVGPVELVAGKEVRMCPAHFALPTLPCHILPSPSEHWADPAGPCISHNGWWQLAQVICSSDGNMLATASVLSAVLAVYLCLVGNPVFLTVCIGVFTPQVVGRLISVWWQRPQEWVKGTVKQFDAATGTPAQLHADSTLGCTECSRWLLCEALPAVLV